MQDEGINKLKLTGINGKQQIAWYLAGNYSANDRLRITITGVKVTNGIGFGIYLSGTGGIDFPASDIHDGVIIKEFTPLADNGFCYLGVANIDNTELLVRSIKIEKIEGSSDPATAIQVVKVNLTLSPYHTSLSDWNNYIYGTTPEFLNDPSGVPTGIKFVVDSGPVITENLGFDPPATTNFPGPISSTLWELEYGGILTWHFTGLDNDKTYTIKTYSFDNYDDGETSISWGGTTQNTLSFNNVTELTFSNIAPISGEISGRFEGSGIYLIINGIILTAD